MTTNIYILKLKNNKYYIGKSQDPEKRFVEHLSGLGSSWTQIHKPIEIIKIIKNSDDFEEDKQVKKLMSLYGIDNVRGGSYLQLELSQEQKNLLQTELRSAQNQCVNCGKNNHFVKDCPIKINKNKKYINKQNNSCFRCGRQNHYANSCYATTHIDGSELNDDESDDDYTDDDDDNSCFRCGRQNHYANSCYATTHINGYKL